MAAILDSDMQMLPLELFVEVNAIQPPKSPNVLLSRFKTLDYDTLETLERSKIFDTGDLELISDAQLSQIGFTQKQCEELRYAIRAESKRFSKLPVMLLDPPENYCIIFYQYINDKLLFEILWKGVSFWWKVNPNKLETFLIELLNFLQSIGLPEMISFTHKLPELDILELPIFDISIYIGNIDLSSDNHQLKKVLKLTNIKEQVFKFEEVLLLSYILDYVTYGREEIMK